MGWLVLRWWWRNLIVCLFLRSFDFTSFFVLACRGSVGFSFLRAADAGGGLGNTRGLVMGGKRITLAAYEMYHII